MPRVKRMSIFEKKYGLPPEAMKPTLKKRRSR